MFVSSSVKQGTSGYPKIMVSQSPNNVVVVKDIMSKTVAFGYGFVIVYGGLITNRETVNTRRYYDFVIQPIIIPFDQEFGPVFLFTDEIVRLHRA